MLLLKAQSLGSYFQNFLNLLRNRASPWLEDICSLESQWADRAMSGDKDSDSLGETRHQSRGAQIASESPRQCSLQAEVGSSPATGLV